MQGAREQTGASFIRALTPITSQSPHFLILSHWGLGSHIWIWEVGGRNTESIAPIHMKCLVCLKNSVHVDNYSILLFLAFVSPALLMGKSIPVLTDSLPVWTDCSRGKGVGWVIWPFSIINPLFKQSVKISQFTQKHSMNVFQAGNELSWLISRGWMSCLWGTSCPTQWPSKAFDKPREMGYIYGVFTVFT